MNNTPRSNKENSSITFIYLSLICIGTILLIYSIGFKLNIDPQHFFLFLTAAFYRPHTNIIQTSFIGNINIYKCVYAVIILTIIIISTINILFEKITKRSGAPSLASIILLNIFSFYFFVTTLQTINISRIFLAELKNISGKSIEEKYLSTTEPETYRFAKFCRKSLPGQHTAELITDLDTSKDPGMLMHRKLAYFLYPIDIRGIRKDPVDSLIIFAAENAAQRVPEDFQILKEYDKHSLIAIKKAHKSND